MGFLSVIKGIGNAFKTISGAGSAIQGAGEAFGGITGIPMPWQKSMGQRGKELADFMNNAYPGTNPWEQLGAGGGGAGSVSVQESQEKHQKTMQRAELATREKVAKIQANASTTSAAIAHGPKAVSGVDQFNRTGQVGPYETPTTISLRKLNAELANIDASTRQLLSGAAKNLADAALTGTENELRKAFLQYKDQLARAEVVGKLTQRELTALTNAGDWIARHAQEGVNLVTPILPQARGMAQDAANAIKPKQWIRQFLDMF